MKFPEYAQLSMAFNNRVFTSQLKTSAKHSKEAAEAYARRPREAYRRRR